MDTPLSYDGCCNINIFTQTETQEGDDETPEAGDEKVIINNFCTSRKMEKNKMFCRTMDGNCLVCAFVF